MSRLIDADALAEEIRSMQITMGGRDIFPQDARDSVLMHIATAPTVNAAPVVHAKWIQIDNSQVHFCSMCGVDFNLYAYCKKDFQWCPSCGSRMDSERRDAE